ncbi:MAG: US12 family protein [Candidatus Heimdallarchaeota archaeon]|nr:MAG: US12 family protein [Candidatus Heimdallarchaeota archaeon]
MSYYYETRTTEYVGYDIKAEAYRHLGIALLIASITVGVMLGLGVPIEIYWVGAIGEFIIIMILLFSALFGSQFSESTAAILLYSFAVCSAITLSLLVAIGLYLDPAIVVGAVGSTTVVAMAAYLFSGRTYERISQITRITFILVIMFLIFAMLGFFLFSENGLFYLIISVFGAIIFSIYMFLDFARLENRAFTSPALMALWLFYDIIYLLKELLLIFIYLFGGSRD